MSEDKESTQRGFSRRRFLQGSGGAAAGSMLVGLAHVAHGQQETNVAPEGLKLYSSSGEKIALKINGKESEVTVTPQTTLLQALRESLELTGSKEVCDRGACGACTVLVDGRSVTSCMMLAIDAVGHQVTTVEGLSQNGKLDPVQQAFVDHDACQCGFCIPGFVVRSRAFLDESPNATRREIQHGLCGNICRCAAYVRIFDAVEAASKGAQG